MLAHERPIHQDPWNTSFVPSCCATVSHPEACSLRSAACLGPERARLRISLFRKRKVVRSRQASRHFEERRRSDPSSSFSCFKSRLLIANPVHVIEDREQLTITTLEHLSCSGDIKPRARRARGSNSTPWRHPLEVRCKRRDPSCLALFRLQRQSTPHVCRLPSSLMAMQAHCTHGRAPSYCAIRRGACVCLTLLQ